MPLLFSIVKHSSFVYSYEAFPKGGKGDAPPVRINERAETQKGTALLLVNIFATICRNFQLQKNEFNKLLLSSSIIPALPIPSHEGDRSEGNPDNSQSILMEGDGKGSSPVSNTAHKKKDGKSSSSIRMKRFEWKCVLQILDEIPFSTCIKHIVSRLLILIVEDILHGFYIFYNILFNIRKYMVEKFSTKFSSILLTW